LSECGALMKPGTKCSVHNYTHVVKQEEERYSAKNLQANKIGHTKSTKGNS